MKTVNILTASFFLSLLFSGVASAALYDSSTAKDSDFDGLTDQGEIQIFKTDSQNPDTDGDGFLDGAEAVVGSDPLDPNDPVPGGASAAAARPPSQASGVAGAASAVAPSQPIANPWPWYISRAAAIVSYLLLSFLVISGIGIQTRLTYKILSPLTAFTLHRHFGIALSTAALTHIFALLFDDYLKFTLRDLLVPLNSNFHPVLVTLGVLGFYMLAAVVITSLFMRVQFPHFWRLLHYLPYPIFVLSFLHGTLLGTDSNTTLMTRVYWSTGVAVGIMTLYRLYHGRQLRQLKKAKLAAAAIADANINQNVLSPHQ